MVVNSTDTELDCTPKLVQQIGGLFKNNDYHDVTLVVENIEVPAHKCILAARSQYFRTLLYPVGGAATATETTILEVKLSDSNNVEQNAPFEAFMYVLKFIYTGCVSFDKIDNSNITKVLILAHQYGIEELESGLASYLIKNLTMQNCCAALNSACQLHLTLLKDATLKIMDQNATEVLNSNNFKTLTQESLNALLERDSFYVPEMEIFKAVLEWHRRSDSDIQTSIHLIRFELINLEDLLTAVRDSSVLDPERLLEIVREKATNKCMDFRFILSRGELATFLVEEKFFKSASPLCICFIEPDVNVASERNCNAKTISGINPLNVIDGNVTNYDGTNGYTYHHITNLTDNCIIIELNANYKVNQIKILLWDGDDRSYSYYVEVSVDQRCWERVCNYSDYFCRSWQYLYFKARPVRYIKLVGTHNTANSDFHVVELEAFYLEDIPNLVDGFISPNDNVAMKVKGAKVIKGLCNAGDTLDVLINGDFRNHTGHSGYTYHNITDTGEDSIVIQLTQPYHIGSLRLLLWDQDDRTHSFYVETSVNQKDWKIAVDKRNDKLKSWQNFTFEPRTAVFIKIVGTHNSANNAFHFVHFEVPESQSSVSQFYDQLE